MSDNEKRIAVIKPRSYLKFRITAATKLLAHETSDANRFIAEIPEGGLKPEGGSENDELIGRIRWFFSLDHSAERHNTLLSDRLPAMFVDTGFGPVPSP